MARLRTGLKWIGRGLAAVLAAAAAGGAWYGYAVLPQVSGELRLAGLTAPVEIVRDSEGIPHIFAQSDQDAVFAQGVVHAQDRLWQMEMHRRIAAGRMAEILGPKALEVDRLLRTLGIRGVAEAMLPRLDAETRGFLDAYAKGVNAFLARRSGPLPPEFLITGAPAPEPWTPADSIGWTLMMAWDLGGNWRTELQRLQLLQKGLSVEAISDLLPVSIGETPPPLTGAAALYKGLYKEIKAEVEAAETLLASLPGFVDGMGSNNWVVSGARSETGKPLLANDPHLGLTAPALWYFAHLSAAGLDVIGASLPGVPGIILGRNQRIAWAFTNTGPDVQDLFIERIDPADPTRYQTPDGWRVFGVREERIKVKGQADVVLRVRSTRHGPIVSDGGLGRATDAAPAGHAIAFAWTALMPENLTPEASSRMNKAGTWPEFLAAVRSFHAPQQNMLYADVDGTIGYVAPGLVPIRKPDNDLNGLFPAPGWDARYDWVGFVPFEALPRELNPASGYRATANERIVAPDYPHHLTYEWATAHRAKRIDALLNARPKHSLESFRDMQADVVSLAVKEALPHLLAAPAAGPRERQAQALLSKWDAAMAADRPEPLIATAWMRQLTRLVYADEVGPRLMPGFYDQRHTFLMSVLAGDKGRARWCDDITTPATESCPDQIARALTAALADLEQRYGADMAAWRWGVAHAARSEHRPLSVVPALARWLEVRVPTGGDTYTVNAGRHNIRDAAEPFTNNHAASLRVLYDLADLERSQFIHSTGQSGLPHSGLYRNMAERWAAVRYIPMRTRRADLAAGSLGTLRLLP